VGAVTVVVRRGKIVHLGTHGFADREKNIPMRPDTIFRLTSNSKVFAALAAMIAWEEGHFQLEDPVSKWIPELKKENLKVIEIDPTDPNKFKLVPAVREISVLDSFTMKTGLPYPGFALKIPWNSPAWKDWYGNPELGYYFMLSDMTLEKYMQVASKLPLINQPGGDFNYGPSLHVVARICEVVSKKSFHDYMTEKLLKPLGLNDTGFYLPKEKGPRFAALYEMTPKGLERIPEGIVTDRLGTKYQADWPYAYGPTKYQAPGENLNSTPLDYVRLLQMLLNKGQLDGVRILGRKTVELMTSDQTGQMCCPQVLGMMGQDLRFGLGVGVFGNMSSHHTPVSPGSFFWGGYFSHHWWVDPKEELVGLIMSQRVPQLMTPYYLYKFDDLVYQAIVD
jgi:CubicO group peptidase (beta-lactamase class C family)